jgi:hypothetical protein
MPQFIALAWIATVTVTIAAAAYRSLLIANAFGLSNVIFFPRRLIATRSQTMNRKKVDTTGRRREYGSDLHADGKWSALQFAQPATRRRESDRCHSVKDCLMSLGSVSVCPVPKR